MMTRQELEAHPSFPFNDFRSNVASFLLLELYWPAVLSEALGAELSSQAVPLAVADRDLDAFGTPVLLSAWFPRRGRGIRVLFNDPPDPWPADMPEPAPPHSRLFLSASVATRPEPWDFPDGGQLAAPVRSMEELVAIADTDIAVADAVAQAARVFLTTDIALDDMARRCAATEAAWIVP
jgi:hypothetical protein